VAVSTSLTNQVLLTAVIAEVKALRHTPSGIPVRDLVLDHESQATEGEHTRQVRATLRAVAFGALAERIGRLAVGSRWRFEGFLANQRANKSLVLHVQEFQPDSSESDL
jgi:primosomal replication protein N